MTKINIGSKDVGFIIDKGFSWVSCDICTYEGGFLAFLIEFHKKVSMTKINISLKDVEYNIDEGFSWVSCDIWTYEVGFQPSFD